MQLAVFQLLLPQLQPGDFLLGAFGMKILIEIGIQSFPGGLELLLVVMIADAQSHEKLPQDAFPGMSQPLLDFAQIGNGTDAFAEGLLA